MTATAVDVRVAPSRWVWATAFVLVAAWTVAHIGCHGNEDTELGVAVPAREHPDDRHAK
jgi:hypothetical protein